MKILILVTPAAGHYLPMSALADELKTRGHSVIFYLPDEFVSRIAALGHPVHALARSPGERFGLRQGKERFSSKNPLSYYRHARRFVEEWVDRHLNEETLSELKRGGFDLVLSDDTLICAKTVAEALGVPLAHLNGPPLFEPDRSGEGYPLLVSGLSSRTKWKGLRRAVNQSLVLALDRAMAPLLSILNEYRLRLGLRPHRRLEESFSEDLLIQTYPKELSGRDPSSFSSRHLFVGPLVAKSRAQAELPPEIQGYFGESPVIYVSFGTLSDQRRLDPLIATVQSTPALRGYFFVFSRGSSVGSEHTILAKSVNSLVLNRVNQIAILRRSRLMIGHGGLNGVLEALSFQCGLLCVPQKFDQKSIALSVEDLGLGKRYSRIDELCSDLPSVLPGMITDPDYRARLRAFADGMNALGGAACAADAIETLARQRAHV